MTKLQALIDYLRKDAVKRVKEKRERFVKRIHRCLSLVQQRRVILYYFGEEALTGDMSLWQPARELGAVARYFGVARNTVHAVIKRFVERGYKVESHRKNAGRPLHYRTSELEALVQTNAHLQSVQELSLKARVIKVSQQLGFRVTYSRLRDTYIRLGIRYTKQHYRYRIKDERRLTLLQERFDYAEKLARLVCSNESIIYFDETSFSNYLRPFKTWQRPQDPLKINMPQKRIGGITLFGAIGKCLPEPVYMTGRSTNKDEVEKFLRKLVRELGRLGIEEKPWLILDNHRAHFTKANKELLDRQFRVLPFPSSSCEFNSIEQLWGLIKQSYRKLLVQREHKVADPEDLASLVNQATLMIPPEMAQSVCNSNRKYLLHLLEAKRDGRDLTHTV